jgi:histidyl-tRNA synthetase
VQKLRAAGVKAEVYPEVVKLKKQLDYANKKGIKKVALIGDNELENKTFMLKNMASGEQEELSLDELILQFL